MATAKVFSKVKGSIIFVIYEIILDLCRGVMDAYGYTSFLQYTLIILSISSLGP